MSYKVSSLQIFDKQAKRLSKKYPSLKKDLNQLIDLLIENPKEGTPLGNNFYKIRLAITSKGKGKSGGGRIITYLKVIHETVFFVSIFDKSEKETISDNELKELFRMIP